MQPYIESGSGNGLDSANAVASSTSFVTRSFMRESAASSAIPFDFKEVANVSIGSRARHRAMSSADR